MYFIHIKGPLAIVPSAVHNHPKVYTLGKPEVIPHRIPIELTYESLSCTLPFATAYMGDTDVSTNFYRTIILVLQGIILTLKTYGALAWYQHLNMILYGLTSMSVENRSEKCVQFFSTEHFSLGSPYNK